MPGGFELGGGDLNSVQLIRNFLVTVEFELRMRTSLPILEFVAARAANESSGVSRDTV